MTTLTTAQLIPSEPEPDPPAAAALTPSEERLIRFCRGLMPQPNVGRDSAPAITKEEVALLLAVRRHLPAWDYDKSGLPGSARVASRAAV